MKNYKRQEFTFDTLLKAYFDCLRHKRSTYQAMRFEYEREKNLCELYDDLMTGNYKIGKSICFIIKEPKYREIWAGSFRDRIVHHVIYNAIYERFVSKFIYDSCSCIVGRGTLFGAKRAQKFAAAATLGHTQDAYFVKMDIKNYFVSINKNILYKLVMEHIDLEEEGWLANLIGQVIYHNPRENVYIKSPKALRDKLPPYKSLFNTTIDYGLPIGNLTSQFFSNIYLNPVDQFAKHVLKCKYYTRYVDDILIIDKDAGFLNYAYAEINKFMIKNLNLELNHKKKNINLVKRGFDYVGHVVKPNHIHVRKRTVNKCLEVIKKWEKMKNREDKEKIIDLRNSMNSYLGLLIHTDSYNLRKRITESVRSKFLTSDDNCRKLVVNY